VAEALFMANRMTSIVLALVLPSFYIFVDFIKVLNNKIINFNFNIA
jgi:hypothetical protein